LGKWLSEEFFVFGSVKRVNILLVNKLVEDNFWEEWIFNRSRLSLPEIEFIFSTV